MKRKNINEQVKPTKQVSDEILKDEIEKFDK